LEAKMKFILLYEVVIYTCYLGVQCLVTAEISSSINTKLNKYIDACTELEQFKYSTLIDLSTYEIENGEKDFINENNQLERLYEARWIWQLASYTNANAKTINSYLRNYQTLEDQRTSNEHLDYAFDIHDLKVKLKTKWDQRLQFDLEINNYLKTVDQAEKSSSTSNSESLMEREDILRNMENKCSYFKSRLQKFQTNAIQANIKYLSASDNAAKYFKESNSEESIEFRNTERNISDTNEIIEDYTWDLNNTQNEIYYTRDSWKLAGLKLNESYFKKQIVHYEKELENLKKKSKTIVDKFLAENKDLKEMENAFNDWTVQHQFQLQNLSNLRKQYELQRIRVLELVSPEERLRYIETSVKNE
ncbi:hypothetical protein EWB00_005554, partial [Schistosoma japonicum]